jgi:hypothetical protein
MGELVLVWCWPPFVALPFSQAQFSTNRINKAVFDWSGISSTIGCICDGSVLPMVYLM